MTVINRDLGQSIESVSGALAEWVVARHEEVDPDLEARYGPDGHRLWRTDVRARLCQLAQAVSVGRPELFADAVAWAKVAFASREVDVNDLRRSLECTAEVLREHLPADIAERAVDHIAAVLAQFDDMPSAAPSILDQPSPWKRALHDFLRALVDNDRERAARVLEDAVEGGATLADVYLGIVCPALVEIGLLWQQNEIGVADEHMCTAVTQHAMTRLFGRIRAQSNPTPRGLTAVIACVGGDMHDIGPRMASELLELDGWRTVFLGANTPVEEIVNAAISSGADLVAVAAGTSFALAGVLDLVERLRATPETAGTKVLVGGRPFAVAPGLWREIGADGCPANARELVALATRVCGAAR